MQRKGKFGNSLTIVGQAGAAGKPGIKPNNPAQRKKGEFNGRAAIVTLGCAKNQVDSEVMAGVLLQHGFEIVTDATRADVAVVNTCGFLQSAIEESIDNILELAALKKSGQLRRLIVTGCAVDRFEDPSNGGGSMRDSLPEVDMFISGRQLLAVGGAAQGRSEESRTAGNPQRVGEVLDSAARPYMRYDEATDGEFLYDHSMPRVLSSPRHYAYVKISEGCNRPCSFCIIPKIRGNFRSRAGASILAEIDQLLSSGVRELNLVAQDLTAFGTSQTGAGKTDNQPIVPLLESIDRLISQRSPAWVRLLYAYPLGITAELLGCFSRLENLCDYLDLPLQHSSEQVLKAMRRPLGKYSPRSLTEVILKHAPQLWLRTTFIVGFPGETEQDVEDLRDFIAEGHFGSVGVFEYSPEQGTPAFEMENQLPEAEKSARREYLMQAQREVVDKRLREYHGRKFEVLIEGLHEETDMLLTGRTRFQAPEVDGIVLINDINPDVETQLAGSAAAEALCGQVAEVTITDSAGYDLVGSVTAIRQETDKVIEDGPRTFAPKGDIRAGAWNKDAGIK